MLVRLLHIVVDTSVIIEDNWDFVMWSPLFSYAFG